MSDKTEEQTYLTPGDVAKLLMVSPAAVRRWAAEGDLKSLTTPGGHRRFLPADIEEFARSRSIAIPRTHKRKLQVLIVDDDIQYSGYLTKLLSKYSEKINFDVANDGYEAGYKIHKIIPDLVLLDLMMPGIDGFKVCEQLKMNKATKNIRIIAMTGYPSIANTNRSYQAGAELCLEKPIERQKLLEILNLE